MRKILPPAALAALALVALVALAALAALALPGGRADAQSAACTNDAGEAVICAVPVIEQPADADDYFLLKVIDQADGEVLNRGEFNTLLEINLTVPSGVTLHSRQSVTIAPKCETEGTASCLLLHRDRTSPPAFASWPRAVSYFYSADDLVFPAPISLTAAAPGQIAVTASLRRPGVADNADAVTTTVNVRYAVPSNPLLVQPFVPGADFVRTNGAEHPLERDRLSFWVGSRTYALTPSDFAALGPDDPPAASITAPEGTFITSFFTCRARNFYSGPDAQITPTDGNVCAHSPSDLPNRSGGFFARTYALGGTFHFSPPATGSGEADITVTWRLDSGVFSRTIKIRYGPDVPADYPIPYPVARVSVPPGALSVAYGDRVRYSFRVIDARDGEPISFRDQLGAPQPVQIDWYDAGSLERSTDTELTMFPDEPSWNRYKRFSHDDLAALLPGPAWDVDLEPVTYPPLGPAGAARGLIQAQAPGITHASLFPSETRTLISFTPFGDYSYSAAEADGVPVVRASLPADLDQILQPGAEEPIRIGLGSTVFGTVIPKPPGYDPPSILEPGIGRPRFTVGCIHPRTSAAEPNRNWPRRRDPNAPPHDCGWNNIVDGAVSYLRISGPASWKDSDGPVLPIGFNTDSDPDTEDEYPVFACSDLDSAGNFICSIRSAAGEFPRIVVDDAAPEGAQIFVSARIGHVNRSSDAYSGWQVIVAELDDVIRTRLGITEDADRKQIIDGLVSFTVGSTPPVATVSLAFADAREAPSLPAGASAQLRLRLQDAEGRPADVSGLSSVTVTADRGALLSSAYCAESSSCALRLSGAADADADAATLSGAADDDAAITDDVRLTLTAPKTGDRIQLYASVVTADGRTLQAELAVDLVGSAARIEIADGSAVRDRATESDDLDRTSLKVAAYDERGNRAALPAEARVDGIAGPGGAAIPSTRAAAELACTDGAARLDCEVAVTVRAAATDPLAVGAYTVKIVAGSLEAEGRFFVAGRAARIELDPGPPPIGLGVPFDLTVRAYDANDQPVAEGTVLAASVSGTGSTVPVLLASPAGGSAPARNGEINIRLVASAPGIGILRIAAGPAASPDLVETYVLDLRALTRVGPLARHLAGGAGALPWSGYRIWTGPFGSDASQLLDEVPALASVRLWNGKRWISYARPVDDGAEPPDSVDFPLQPGDLLFLFPVAP